MEVGGKKELCSLHWQPIMRSSEVSGNSPSWCKHHLKKEVSGSKKGLLFPKEKLFFGGKTQIQLEAAAKMSPLPLTPGKVFSLLLARPVNH